MSFEVIPFLSLNGHGVEAISFYEQYLGAKILFKKSYKEMKDMDPQFNYEEGQDDYIAHSVLQIGANKIMIAEEEMDLTRPWQLSNSSSLCIQSKDFSRIETIYHALIKHNQVHILTPFEKNVFSPGYGIIRDPFGMIIQLTVTKHDF
ncbi:VOC family protein [Hazenella sp. IB182353]|uniref:VOC family protein n=1 Tax=Polycladospora coralii TaxID=2771432 RepID=UPI0017479656|nr:VOC family protein [Polycladospora coralii]MBS7528927.1 VOC family protein [Polycladospora coralii]